MNRCCLALLAAAFSSLCWSQITILPYDSLVDAPAHRMHRITAEGWADQNSNTVFNELPWNIYLGGYIERDLRERSRDELKDRNRTGYDVGVRLSWVGADSLFGRARLRPMVSAAYRNQLGVRFTRDVFELAFFGNAHFEDRTALLSPSAHAQLTWQSLGFGVQDATTRSFIRLDLIRGRAFNSSEIRDARLYTAPDGRLLQLHMDATYWQSDTAGGGHEHTNGAGLSLSGQINKAIKIAGREALLSLRLEDAGFITWNPNSVRIERDTLITYEGLAIENIFDLGDVIIGEDQVLDTFGLRYKRGAYTSILPFRAALAFEIALDERWKAGLMVDQRYMPGYVPRVMLTGSRRFGERMMLGVSVDHGGYGGLRFGLATRFRIGNALIAELGSTHVPGFFLGTTRGVGAYVGITVAL